MTDVTRRIEPLHLADWLALAAAPTFGMVLMYVLMSGFHLTPWLKLISRCAKRWRGRPQRVALCGA